MAKMRMEFEAKDNASATIDKITKNTVDAAKKIMGSDESIAQATKTASRQKMEALTLSQKMKFAIAKETAAGDKHQLNLVNQKEKLAKLERQLRSAIKHGDDNAQGLAKQVAEQRKHVSALEDDTKAQDENNDRKGKSTKLLKRMAAAAAVAAAGLVYLVKRTSEHGDELKKQAERLQMNVEQFQKLDYGMKLMGTSLEEQEGALNSFTKMARDASLGTGAAAAAFALFGVELKNGDGTLKSTHQLLLDTADGFANTADSMERSAAMQDIFGESGTKLTQFLDQGAVGIAAMGVEAENLGAILSETAAVQGEGFVDAMTRLDSAIGGVTQTISERFQPIFTRVMEESAKAVGKSNKAWSKYFDTFEPFARAMTTGFVWVFKWVAKAMVGAATAGMLAWEGAKVYINNLLAGWFDVLKDLRNKLRGLMGKDAIPDDGFNPFIDSANEAKDAAQKLIDASAETLAGIDATAAAATNWGKAQREDSTPATNESTEATKRQAEQLKKQVEAAKAAADATKALEKAEKDLNDKRAAHLASFVSGRAKAREANLQLHEDILKKTQAETDASIKQSARMAESLGAAMGTALAEVAKGTGDVKDVFKAMAQSTVRAIQQVVSALLIKAATNAGSTAAAFGPIAAAGAASATFAMLSGVIAGFKDGGIVPGTGSGDVFPAMLEPGELVLPKAMASDLLQIAGKTTTGHFNEGGRVGRGGAGALAVHFHEGIMPRSPAELDRYVRDKLAPSLRRLKRQGAIA